MSDFYEKVYDVARLIPFGRVTSYGAIAKYLGSPQSSRLVGWAMNKAGYQDRYIPAHRVVNRNGMLSGKAHFGAPNAMQELLENEGHEIKDNCIINFADIFWDPQCEI